MSKSLSKKAENLIVGLIIAVFVVPISLALATSSAPIDMFAAPREVAAPETQFKIDIAYSYVGPAPSNVVSHDEKATNSTMHLASQYPSVVRLNITRIPGVQIAACDAAVEVYGIKIAADTGPTEYYAYFMGTNYNPSFSQYAESTFVSHVNALVDHDLYHSIAGNFNLNWTYNTPFITNTIGSIMSYTDAPIRPSGLSVAGKPNDISITIYRIGYITTTNGSISIYEDPSNSTPKDMVQLSNYKDGFLYNDIVSPAQLPGEKLFHPID